MSDIINTLIGWTMRAVLWTLYRVRRSRTGYANPRVRHIVGSLGFYAHTYLVVAPNILNWLKHRSDLFPAVVQLQTVNRCNASCAMCPYPYTTHLEPREVMDDALYTKIAVECASEPDFLELVPMAKNEPLLDKKLEARIAEFKAIASARQMVGIVTNGSLLTPARFKRLVDSGADMISVSLSADNEDTYHKVMAGLSWRTIMQNLEGIAAADTARVNVFLRFIKQRDNLAEAKAFLKRWRKRGFNILAFEMNNRSGSVRDFNRLAGARTPPLRHLRRAMGRQFYRLCPHAFSIMHVLQNGDVPLCTNDWHNREVLGNVRHNTIREIFNVPRFQEIRELMRQGRYDEIEICKGCSFRKEWL